MMHLLNCATSGSKRSIQMPSGKVTTYAWDPLNRLISALLPGGLIRTMAYQYDDLLAIKQGPQGTVTVSWMGEDILCQTQGAGIQLYSQGGELVRALGAKMDGTPLNRQYHLDTQGNALAITGPSQAVEVAYTLDAFGNVITGNTENENHYDFAGGLGYWSDPDLGFTYVTRARWLNNKPAPG
jgi:YD repeat-containing protein